MNFNHCAKLFEEPWIILDPLFLFIWRRFLRCPRPAARRPTGCCDLCGLCCVAWRWQHRRLGRSGIWWGQQRGTGALRHLETGS